jgi:hypothetical protein
VSEHWTKLSAAPGVLHGEIVTYGKHRPRRIRLLLAFARLLRIVDEQSYLP